MIKNVKISCFPTLVQRRQLIGLMHTAAMLREELTKLEPSEVNEAPLAQVYRKLPSAMLQQAWKQAERMKKGTPAERQSVRKTLPLCQWRRSELKIGGNQLCLSFMDPIYYIAPVSCRRMLQRGVVLKATLKETEGQWTAVLCLLIEPETKRSFHEGKTPAISSQSLTF